MKPKSVSAGFRLGTFKSTPGRFIRSTDGKVTQVAPHRAELPVERSDLPEALSAFLSSTGREQVLCTIAPPDHADGELREWKGRIAIAVRKFAPSPKIEGASSVRFSLVLESEAHEPIAEFFAVWIGAVAVGVLEATITLQRIQLELGDAEAAAR